MHDLVACRHCGWVHMAVTEDFIKDWENEWARFWPTLTDEGKEAYGVETGPPTRDIYLHCHRCNGSYLHFRTALDGDYPSGSTISPILRNGE